MKTSCALFSMFSLLVQTR